jgi:hypothetical protein
MQAAFASMSPAARVPRLPERELEDVFARLLLDRPDIFYVKSYTYRCAPGADWLDFQPVYLYDRAKILTQRQALQTRLRRLLSPAEGLTETEKEAFAHDFILNHVRYDKLKKEYSHEVIGPLANGVGVCEGIAKTVKLLLDELQVACIVAVSEADPAHGVKYRHAWNLVRLNGKWYHLDATFDNTLSREGAPRYDYFSLDDAHIFRDHRPGIYPLPVCPDGAGFYYRAQKLSFTKFEDADSRVRQALRKRQPGFVFHWRGGFLTREVLARLLEDAANAAEEKSKFVSCSVNFPQAVISLRFLDAPAEELREDDAMEAENQD